MTDSKSTKKEKLDLSKLSVRELLLIGENPQFFGSQLSPSTSDKELKLSNSQDDDDEEDDDDDGKSSDGSEMDDWEEVDDKHVEAQLKKLDATGDSSEGKDCSSQASTIPEGGLQIVIPQEGVFRKKTKGATIEDILRQEINRGRTEYQKYLHKTSLLCQLARGLQLNNAINSAAVMDAIRALLTDRIVPTFSRRSLDLSQLSSLVRWFRINLLVYQIKQSMMNSLTVTRKDLSLEEFLAYLVMENKSLDRDHYVMIFVAYLRFLKIEARLVVSLQPLPLKPPASDLIRKKPNFKQESKDDDDERKTAKRKKKSTCKTEVEKVKSTNKDEKAATVAGEAVGSEIIDPDIFILQPPSVQVVQPQDLWVEVFLRKEGWWISVDVLMNKFICDKELEVNATKPISYILGFDNNGKVRDVTRRYASQWLVGTQKLRVESSWWSSALKPFKGKKSERDVKEDDFLDRQVLSLPVPNSMSLIKGHPLYVLRRHLHKYEALHPDKPPSVGFVKNEPIYSREFVHTLHTRELWMREAKVVRIGEKPYKIVKARPKYDKRTGARLPDTSSELFGLWQTENFIPPIAQDGKVPRNEWGNVELFTEKLLPQGCVHLRLPGLQRIARKLDIDCAPAVVGFDFGCGGSRPSFDGFVVCEEFKVILEDAWNKDQDEKQKKDEDKRVQRVYRNWRKLVRGVLIRLRLEKKYSINLSSKRKADDNVQSADDTAVAGSSKRTRGNNL